MIWIVKRIEESDFGCEERMPGEPLMDLVTLECEDGRICQFEVPDNWLLIQEIDEGDEWPEDLDEDDADSDRIARMEECMENYFDSLAQLENEE